MFDPGEVWTYSVESFPIEIYADIDDLHLDSRPLWRCPQSFMVLRHYGGPSTFYWIWVFGASKNPWAVQLDSDLVMKGDLRPFFVPRNLAQNIG